MEPPGGWNLTEEGEAVFCRWWAPEEELELWVIPPVEFLILDDEEVVAGAAVLLKLFRIWGLSLKHTYILGAQFYIKLKKSLIQ